MNGDRDDTLCCPGEDVLDALDTLPEDVALRFCLGASFMHSSAILRRDPAGLESNGAPDRKRLAAAPMRQPGDIEHQVDVQHRDHEADAKKQDSCQHVHTQTIAASLECVFFAAGGPNPRRWP